MRRQGPARPLPLGAATGPLLAAALFLAAGCGAEDGTDRGPGSGPPTIAELRILPSEAYAASILNAAARTADPQGGPVEVLYQWLRNGAEVPGATASTLRAPAFRRGDTITVRATPLARGARGLAVTAPPVTIRNSPPVIVGVSVSSGSAPQAENFTAHVEVRDPDEDPLTLTYQWLRNDAPIPGATAAELPAKDLRKGDKIVLRATASDGEAQAGPVDSTAVRVLNRPPRVVALPQGQTGREGEVVYRVAAEDPDGDLLTYRLSPEAPKGMSIDPQTGIIRWRAGPGERGTHRFAVLIDDGDGGVVRQEVFVVVGER